MRTRSSVRSAFAGPLRAALVVAFAGCGGGEGVFQGAPGVRSYAAPPAPWSLGLAQAPDLNAAPSAPGPPPAPRDVRMPTDWRADLGWNAEGRLAHARRAKGDEVKALFASAGVAFPPHDLLLRVFKKEGELEVWVGDKDAPMKRLATYGICAASGGLGPKRNEGDEQVPEGYYKVGYYHPMSAYYLSAQVDYPNASDKIRGGAKPGGDILIHGRCGSIGCVAMSDERIEEIYLVGWAAFVSGRPTTIHIFPSRDMGALLADETLAEHHEFWREIRPGLEAFERSHRLPAVRIEKDGRYVVTPAAASEDPHPS